MNNIIHIYGPQGTGKTTMAKAFSPYAIQVNYSKETEAELIGLVTMKLTNDRSVIIDEFVFPNQGRSAFIDMLLFVIKKIKPQKSRIIVISQQPLPDQYYGIIDSLSSEMHQKTLKS
jgi:chromosomal replication initiation ATPase DnaA